MKAARTTRNPLPRQELESRETFNLISADKIEGTPVYNPSGDKVGTVDRLMIEKSSGKIAYVVMSFGGFLGVGEGHYPLPWNALDYDARLDGYVVDLDPDTLRSAPTYGRNDVVDWRDEAWNRRLHDYYGVPPYWL